MSRRAVVILAVLAALAVGGAVAGVFGFLAYVERNQAKRLAEAEAYFSGGEWGKAKSTFAVHLLSNPDDANALEKYAEASLNMTSDRRRAIRDAGRAYFELAQLDPDNVERQDRVVEFYERYGLWDDVEYTTGFFMQYRPDDPYLKFKNAYARQVMGQTTEAIDIYQELIDNGTDNPEVYAQIARLYAAQNMDEIARTYLEEGRERFGSNPELTIAEVHFLMADDRREEAKAVFEELFESGKGSSETYAMAGQMALGDNQYEEALALGRSSYELDPTNPDALLLMAYALDALDRDDEAIDFIEKTDPVVLSNHPQLMLTLCEMYLAEEDIEGFHSAASRYESSYPNNYLVLDYLWGREYLLNGETENAIEMFTNVVQGNPNFDRAQIYLARAHLRSSQTHFEEGNVNAYEEQLSRARSALEMYRRNRPEDQAAQRLWSTIFGAPPTYDAARTAAANMAGHAESDPQSALSVGQALLSFAIRQGVTEEDAKAAESLFMGVIEADPKLTPAYTNLVELFIETDELERAQNVVDRAVEAGIDESSLRFSRAILANAKNEPEKADEIMRTAVSNPETNVVEVGGWANRFADMRGYEEGLRVLDLAAESRNESDRALLSVLRVELTARLQGAEAGLAEAQSVRPAVEGSAVAADRLASTEADLIRGLINSGDTEGLEQIGDYVEQLTKNTKNPDSLSVRARYLLFTGDGEGAEAAARQATAADNQQADAWLVLAELMNRRGLYEESAEYARRAVAVEGERGRAALLLARALLRTGDASEARDLLDGVVLSNPDNAPALELYVRALINSGQANVAEAHIARLEMLAADQPELKSVAANLRGLTSLSERKWDAAYARYSAEYEKKPDEFRVVRGLVQSLSGLGREKEANETLQTYLNKNSADPEAWTFKGERFRAGGTDADLLEASSAYTQALLSEGNYAPALRGMMDVQFRLQNFGTALAMCDRLLRITPRDDEILFAKARILAMYPERIEEAFETIESAIAIRENEDYLNLRALINMDRENYRAAIVDFQSLREIYGRTDADIDSALAVAYASIGEIDLAKRFYDSAVRGMDNGAPGSNARLARAKALIEGADSQ